MLQIHSSLLLFSCVVALGACSAESSIESTDVESPESALAVGTEEAAAGTASIRVVHASADAPAVDVYVRGNNTPVIRGLSFGQTSAYLSVPSGRYQFVVRAAGAASTSTPVYTSPRLTLGNGKTFTAIASGSLQSAARGDAAAAFRLLPLAESFGVAAPSTARVRIVHTSADAPTVGIDVGDDNPAAPEVASLARFASTGPAGVSLPSDVPLQVGVTAGGGRVTSFTTPALPNGANVFVIATGFLAEAPDNLRKTGFNRDGFELLAVGPQGTIGFIKQNPLVYALHASPDAPRVDVFAGASRLYSGLSFGELSSGLRVPPGTYTLDVFAAQMGGRPASAPVFSYTTPALAAGERYLAVARGFLAPRRGEQGFGFTALPVTRAGLDNDNGTTFLHAVPDAPAVDIESQGFFSGVPETDAVGFEGVSFGGSGTKEYPQFGFTRRFGASVFTTLFASRAPVVRFDATVPEQGFVVVTGTLGRRPQPDVRLISIDVKGFQLQTTPTDSSFYNPWVAKTTLASSFGSNH